MRKDSWLEQGKNTGLRIISQKPAEEGKLLNKVQWAVIYGNIPLWVTIVFLAFLLNQW